jgi:HSP20 family protein
LFPLKNLYKEGSMNRIVRFDPIKELQDVRVNLDQFVDKVFGKSTWETAVWNPSVDIYENEESIVIKAELPGVAKENVTINLTGDTLSISGKTAKIEETQKENYYRKEIREGSFTRTFTIPCPIERNQVKATQKDGILEITLPKAEEAKAKEVSISVE